MLNRGSPTFDRLLAHIDDLPVIDCHEHMAGPEHLVRYTEPIAFLIAGYYANDLTSAGLPEQQLTYLRDDTVATSDKWPLFKAYWERSQHTAYARVTKLVMRDAYGEHTMSLATLNRIGERLAERDPAYYRQKMRDANIRCVITDALGWPPGDFGAFLRGEQVFEDGWRPVVPLPLFHVLQHHEHTARDWRGLQQISEWADQPITSLDEFTEAVFEILRIAKERGALALKDQCAYNRTLAYDVVTRADAERIFNRLLNDANAVLGWPEAKPLDDYLFHQYMRFAHELDFPVQIHTGHMAGSFNRVDKANVRKFVPVLELHRDVKFDLFHGNWPYMGDLLFVAKNYPNVALNLTWLYIIDPLYAQQLLERAVMTVPHSKIHAFGGDYTDIPERTLAHIKLARHVIAAALANLVDIGWLDEEQARSIAGQWFFDNPSRFFALVNDEQKS